MIVFDTLPVDSLLSRNVDPCCTDTKKRSPLHMAAAKGNEKMGMTWGCYSCLACNLHLLSNVV